MKNQTDNISHTGTQKRRRGHKTWCRLLRKLKDKNLRFPNDRTATKIILNKIVIDNEDEDLDKAVTALSVLEKRQKCYCCKYYL